MTKFSYVEIAKILNRTNLSVRKKARQLNIERFNEILLWKDDEINFLIKNYKILSNKTISVELKRDVKSIAAKAVELKITNSSGRKYDLNENFFKTWTADMAYILGFIYADGSIKSSKKSESVTISIHNKDEYILDLFQEKMKSNYPISIPISNFSMRTLCLNSNKLVSDLKSFGLINNKSCIIQWPKVPQEYKYDFIRGFMDGDGWVRVREINSKRETSKKKCLFVGFCGGENFISSLLAEINIDFNTNINFYKSHF